MLLPLLAVGGMALGTPHLHLTKSFPEKDQVLYSSPEKIQLWFSQGPELALTRVKVTGPGDSTAALGKATAGPKHSIVVPIADTLLAGSYTVQWQAGSPDGHRVKGSFQFVIAPEEHDH